jgi:S1-C subfamily serine protease
LENYLSYRWPGGAPQKPGRKKKHRLGRNLLVCLALIAALAGVSVAGWFLAEAALTRWTASVSDTDNGDSGTKSHTQSDTDETEQAILSAPRAEVGLGVTLELDETATEPLTAQEIYEQVLPSVVSVAAKVPGKTSYSVGSGVIMREDGYILTNFHVVEEGSELSVMLLSDGGTYEAELVGYDEELDIAVLKIEAEGLAAARFGDSDDLRVGDAAYAIGNPMGYLYGTMTDGIISAVDQEVEVGDYSMTLIQTTAALNSGNSGGALINEYGQVVGITVAKISGTVDSALVEGLGLAIPISAVRPYINHILDTGETWRPTIGITCYAVEADGTAGIWVETVDPETPAYEAGLTRGDVIIQAQGKPVTSVYALKRVLGEVGADGELTCVILRDGQELELTFVLYDGME